jgi:choline dehydrogenase-like flavoprotein
MCRTSPPATFGVVAEHYDVIIVGSGAGGGTLAHTLAPFGKRILLLERGDFLPREAVSGRWATSRCSESPTRWP